MDYSLIILPLAQREIDEALFWFESQQKELGLYFLTYLESHFLTLQKGHVKFQIRKLPFYRELPLTRFPFVIIYDKRE